MGIIELFLTFFKIGLFTFGGGFAMIPLIRREISRNPNFTISDQEFMELLTLAQSAPGPIALNMAVFVGYRNRGLRGALTSLFGVVLPSFAIILVVAMFFADIRENLVVDAAFKAMRPAVVALILVPVLGLARGLHWFRYVVIVVVAMVIWHFEVSPVLLLLCGAIVGAIWAYKLQHSVK